MKLVDMIETPKEQSLTQGPMPAMAMEDNKPRYPYGLEISLNAEGLKKLGMGLPKPGEEMYFYVCARVVGVNTSADEDDEQSYVRMQIVEMAKVDDAEAEEIEEAYEEKEAPPPRARVLRKY